eukprot:jgi/Chlat1/5841/Chrsp4S06358
MSQMLTRALMRRNGKALPLSYTMQALMRIGNPGYSLLYLKRGGSQDMNADDMKALALPSPRRLSPHEADQKALALVERGLEDMNGAAGRLEAPPELPLLPCPGSMSPQHPSPKPLPPARTHANIRDYRGRLMQSTRLLTFTQGDNSFLPSNLQPVPQDCTPRSETTAMRTTTPAPASGHAGAESGHHHRASAQRRISAYQTLSRVE